jgi:hypothetical protein
MDIPWHDSDFAFAWGDDAWTVGADESACLAHLHHLPHLKHIFDWNSFCNANDEGDTGLLSFKDRIGCEWRWNEDKTCVALRLLTGLKYGIEDGKPKDGLPAFTWRHTPNKAAPVGEALLCVKAAGLASDALRNDARRSVNQDGHGGYPFG